MLSYTRTSLNCLWCCLYFPSGTREKSTKFLHSRVFCSVSWALGFTDPILLFGLSAWLVVCHSPWLGHIFWHFGSAGALFIWWYMLRVRPGDMVQTDNAKADLSVISILFFVAIKNACRRLSMVLPFPVKSQRDQCLYLAEHIFFASLGFYCVFFLPETSSSVSYGVGGKLIESDTVESVGSWAYNTSLCWTGSVYPSGVFHLFYLGKWPEHKRCLGHASFVGFAVTCLRLVLISWRYLQSEVH